MADMRALGWAQSFPIAGGVAAGRRWTQEHLASLAWTRGAPETVDDVLLTVSELITNAHTHAHSAAQLVLAWDSRCLNVYVSDTGPGLPVAREDEGTLAPSGRGLTIVDALADEWDTRPSPHGKGRPLRPPAPPDLAYAAAMDEIKPPAPEEAFELLLTGNRRFVAGAPKHPNQDAARRAEIAPGQRPFAVVFGCSDSRLAAEIIFDRGLGDLFVVRTAGHVLGAEVLGSIEYGADVLDCPLVVVLGHDACGAVGAACAALEDGIVPAGYVRDVVERVTPSVLAARAAGRVAPDEILAEHIRHTVDLLMERSRVLAERVDAGRAAVVGLRYRLADGSAQVVATHGIDVTTDPVV